MFTVDSNIRTGGKNGFRCTRYLSKKSNLTATIFTYYRDNRASMYEANLCNAAGEEIVSKSWPVCYEISASAAHREAKKWLIAQAEKVQAEKVQAEREAQAQAEREAQAQAEREAQAQAEREALPSILEDIRAGFVRRAYLLPEQGLALVFFSATGNEKIKADRWIYPDYTRRGFLSATVAPIEDDGSPLRGVGARARAEILACDKSCYWLSKNALAHHGRTMPEGRKGKAATEPGAQCYVKWHQIRQGLEAAKEDKVFRLAPQTMWRLTNWGDLSVLPHSFLSELIQALSERGGWSSRKKGDQVLAYTNAWRAESSASPEVRELLRGRAMASCSSLVEYSQALSEGWTPFLSDNGEDPEPLTVQALLSESRALSLPARVVPCKGKPGGIVTCSVCRVCDGAQAPVLELAH